MPAQQGKVSIPSGLSKMHAQVKDREIKTVGDRLPPGLRGIAEVVKAYIGTHQSGANQGKQFFMMEAKIETPDQFNGEPIAGRFTRINTYGLNMPWASDTPTVQQEKWGKITDAIRTLLSNGDKKVTSLDWGSTDEAIWQNFQKFMAMVNASQKEGAKKIYTLYSTSQKQKQKAEKKGNVYYVGARGPYKSEAEALEKDPYLKNSSEGIWENWNGGCDFDPNEKNVNGMHPSQSDDNSTEEPAPVEEGTSSDVGPADDADSFEQAHDQAAASEQVDIDALVAACNGRGPAATKAQEEIRRLALESGLSEEEVDDPKLSWQGLADLMQAQESGQTEEGEQQEEQTEEESAPGFAVGQVYGYKPPHKNIKGRKLAKINVEITKYDAAKELVDLVKADDKKVKYLKVSTDDLEDAVE